MSLKNILDTSAIGLFIPYGFLEDHFDNIFLYSDYKLVS